MLHNVYNTNFIIQYVIKIKALYVFEMAKATIKMFLNEYKLCTFNGIQNLLLKGGGETFKVNI